MAGAESTESRGKARVAMALALGSALGSSALLWGFTVDDALITARVAHHLRIGVGYRFNPDGPVSDAVTPLGYAHLLAPFAGGGPEAALLSSRVLGTLLWFLAAAWLGQRIGRRATSWRALFPLALLAVSLPLGAWPGAGMETGLVTALTTFALAPTHGGTLAAGVAAGLRPELLPFAMTLGIGQSFARRRLPSDALRGLALAIGPAIVVGVARGIAFGTPMPLSQLAKPASFEDGIRYALAAFVFGGPTWLLLAPVGLARLERQDQIVAVATVVHFAAAALAGGDWMPAFRLVVPVLPACIAVGSALASRTTLASSLVRLGFGLGASGLLFSQLFPASRNVLAQRQELAVEGRALLLGAQRIATLDAGWVGAATGVHVVDVAGVTDEAIARLPGGHTSKRLDDDFLDRHRVDALVALWDDGKQAWFRRNDARLAALAEDAGFSRVGELRLRGSSYRYAVFRRPRAASGPAPR